MYYSWTRTQTNRRIKAFRSDNGGEYTSQEFKTFIKAKGIEHQFTAPATAESNGTAERLNRTILDKTRSMMASASMPKNLWAETVTTAVYILNRSPHSHLNCTPFELWYGYRPSLEHMRVFGCSAIKCVTTSKRSLDPRGKECILVGYCPIQRTYKLYDHQQCSCFYL